MERYVITTGDGLYFGGWDYMGRMKFVKNFLAYVFTDRSLAEKTVSKIIYEHPEFETVTVEQKLG